MKYYFQLATGERKYFDGKCTSVKWEEECVDALDENGNVIAMVPIIGLNYIGSFDNAGDQMQD